MHVLSIYKRAASFQCCGYSYDLARLVPIMQTSAQSETVVHSSSPTCTTRTRTITHKSNTNSAKHWPLTLLMNGNAVYIAKTASNYELNARLVLNLAQFTWSEAPGNHNARL